MFGQTRKNLPPQPPPPFVTTVRVHEDSFFRRPFQAFQKKRSSRRSSSLARLTQLERNLPANLRSIEESQLPVLPAITPRSGQTPEVATDETSSSHRTPRESAQLDSSLAVNRILEQRQQKRLSTAVMQDSPLTSKDLAIDLGQDSTSSSSSIATHDDSSVEDLEEEENEDEVAPTAVGLGPTLWIHRFMYKTKQQIAETRRLKELAIQKADCSGDKLTTKSQEGNFANTIVRPLERKVSWGNLRTKLINAKITEAFTHSKFSLKGERYTALKCLGEGGYSKVYEVFNKSKQLFALKVVNLAGLSDSVQQDLLQEISFLERFKGSHHVIQLMEHEHVKDDKENVLYLLLERGECDLATILTRLENDESLTPAKLRFYWEQMLEAVQTIHKKGIVHADIKPHNFVLVHGYLKVIDFGLAGELAADEETLMRKFVGGTREYMSPESMGCYVIEEGAFDVSAMREKEAVLRVGFKSDIWALGVILYQLVYNGIAPFSSVPGGRLGKLKAMLSPDVPVDFEPMDDTYLLQTLKMCLEKDVEKRATLSQLLNHRFLRPVNAVTDDATKCLTIQK